MEALGRPNVDTFLNSNKLKVVVLVDSVRSLLNIGSIFRTSDAFAIEKIVLCGICGTPPNREIEKSALGATQSVLWEYQANICAAITHLKNEEYHIIAVEQTDSSCNLADFEINKENKYALILGNEVDGVSDEALNLCDTALEIDQGGTKHSLNVSVAAGIVLWHFYNFLKN